MKFLIKDIISTATLVKEYSVMSSEGETQQGPIKKLLSRSLGITKSCKFAFLDVRLLSFLISPAK